VLIVLVAAMPASAAAAKPPIHACVSGSEGGASVFDTANGTVSVIRASTASVARRDVSLD
jgi:hypothetical protein